jgi:RimJ/RimL family protein N-acetyltransferase
MTETVRVVRDYGLHQLGFPRLIAIVHPENRASQRVCEKISMVREREG